jgi:hypothetical protein
MNAFAARLLPAFGRLNLRPQPDYHRPLTD